MLLYLQITAAGFAPSFQSCKGAFPDIKKHKRPNLSILNAYPSGIQLMESIPDNLFLHREMWMKFHHRKSSSHMFCMLDQVYFLVNFKLHVLMSLNWKATTDGVQVNSDKNYKWRLVIAYDGTRFAGWQYQPVTPTVQCLVEGALTRITKLDREKLSLVGAGRTDAGVHAWGQVAHFLTPFNYGTLDGLYDSLNGVLPSDIRVREVSPAVPEFHARFSVRSKTYHYKIYNETILDPFLRLYAYHSSYKLNVDVMRDAARHFIGQHDFSAFSNVSRNDRAPNPVKKIFRFDIIETGPLLRLEVEGTGFLYRQVRNMVALLLQIGREVVPSYIVPEILASRDRKELAKYAYLAPPHGLSLVSISYNEEHLKLPLGAPSASSGRHHRLSKCKLPCF